jgi:hypothetical protein
VVAEKAVWAEYLTQDPATFAHDWLCVLRSTKGNGQ